MWTLGQNRKIKFREIIMDIILLQDIENVGQAGDVVNVKPGFARNKLIPDGLALRASKRNLAVAEERKRVNENKKARGIATNQLLANKLSKTEITIEVKVGEEEKMFGSITTKDIHEALIEKGFKIDRHAIELQEPIKALGIYHITVNLAPGINGDVKIYIIKG